MALVAHFVGEQDIGAFSDVTVDSTLGFPTAGWLKIGGAYYAYNGKTSTMFFAVVGTQWQHPTGTLITFVQAAEPLPSLVAEYHNEGVGATATLAVPGQKGDVVVVVLCVTQRSTAARFVFQDPPPQAFQQMYSNWLNLAGVNGVEVFQGSYRFMVDKTQVFNWTLDQSLLWRFAAIVYRGVGTLPRYGTTSSWGADGSYAYDLHIAQNPLAQQPYRMLDVVAAKSSGSTIVYPDPDPGVMTSFQDFGPVPYWFTEMYGSATYPVNLSSPGQNWSKVLPGDFLLLQAWSATGGSTPLPSGWTSLYANTNPQCLVAYNVWQPGDPTTVGVGEQTIVSIYRGVHPTNPIDAVRSSSPAVNSPGNDPRPITQFNGMLIECLFLTNANSNYYVDNPSNRVGTYGSYQDRGFQERNGLGIYGHISMAMVDRPSHVGSPAAPVWTWGNGQPISALSGTSAQVGIALRPAVPAAGQASWDNNEIIVGAGPRKSTVAFFGRSPSEARSYLVEDEAGGFPAGSWLINSVPIAPPDVTQPFGPMLDASEASIVVCITGLEGWSGYSVDGTPRDVWLSKYPEDARRFLTGFPDSPAPENCSALMFLDDEANTIAIHPYSKGRDTWGYGPQVSPDGMNFIIPNWFEPGSIVCVNLAGDTLWSLPNYDIDTPLCYSADGNLVYAYCYGTGVPHSIMTLDAKTGDLLANKPLSNMERYNIPWEPQLTPDGLLIGASYHNDYPYGISTVDPATGTIETWLLWADIEDQLPFTRYGSNPLVRGNWGLDVHPGGDGLVVAVRHAYPVGALIEISWDKQVTNTYQLSDWAHNRNGKMEMIECCYSQDGNYLYAVDDLGNLLVRFERGPGNIGGEAPFMNLSYVSRADWEADGFPDGLGWPYTDDHAAWWGATTGVGTRVPSTLRPTNVISGSAVGVRSRW